MVNSTRRLTFPELQTLVGWAEAEGWEPGQNDPEMFWRCDADGFMAVESDGVFAGGGAVIKHSERFGFMGLFIIDEALRGHGIGRELWYARRDALLHRLGDQATIGLDGVDAMVPFYAKGGFVTATRHRRFSSMLTSTTGARDSNVVELSSVDDRELSAYDQQCFPAERIEFLRYWSQQSSAVALAFREGDVLRGFGVIRRCVSGYRIGPLFADNVEVADCLFLSLTKKADAFPVFIDIPDANSIGIQWAIGKGMEEVFGCERMYFGPPPDIRQDKIFGVTTLEIG